LGILKGERDSSLLDGWAQGERDVSLLDGWPKGGIERDISLEGLLRPSEALSGMLKGM